MSISNYAENKILDKVLRNTDFTVATVYASLHTADPGETGANEVSTGSYGRQAASFSAASSGSTSNSGDLNFTGMPAVTIVAVALWDASTSGNCLWTGWLGDAVDFVTALASSDVITSYGHGLSDDDRVVFEARDGAGLPGGISAGTIYYVINSATDTFKISTSSGGSAVNISADGEGAVIKVTPKTIANAGDTFQIAAGNLVVGLD